MLKKLISTVAITVVVTSGVLASTLVAQTTQAKQKSSPVDQIKRVANRNQQEKQYKLEYKLKKGETIQTVTDQAVQTKFQLAGTPENSTSRGKSTHVWKVINVDKLGQMTFSLSLKDTDNWQQTDGGDPITYNNKTHKEGEEVPEAYRPIAQSVGKTLAVYSVAPNGKILDRRSDLPSNNFGLGEVIDPLPSQPIPVGFSWAIQTTLDATDERGKSVKLSARIRYELARVRGNTAFISFKTEVLTPGISEKVKSTIITKLSKGEIAFDMEKGRPSVKEARWNGKAQGFEGPDSFLSYVSKMTRTFTNAGSTSSTIGATSAIVANKNAQIKTRDGAPVMRK